MAFLTSCDVPSYWNRSRKKVSSACNHCQPPGTADSHKLISLQPKALCALYQLATRKVFRRSSKRAPKAQSASTLEVWKIGTLAQN